MSGKEIEHFVGFDAFERELEAPSVRMRNFHRDIEANGARAHAAREEQRALERELDDEAWEMLREEWKAQTADNLAQYHAEMAEIAREPRLEREREEVREHERVSRARWNEFYDRWLAILAEPEDRPIDPARERLRERARFIDEVAVPCEQPKTLRARLACDCGTCREAVEAHDAEEARHG